MPINTTKLAEIATISTAVSGLCLWVYKIFRRPRKSMDSRSAEPNLGPDWIGPVTLTASDHYNLWCRVNAWMIRERCEGWDLYVRFPRLAGEPVVRFEPWSKASEGVKQGGMVLTRDEEMRRAWRGLAADTTAANTRRFDAVYRYVRRR
jgi:hypothetical protein